MTSAEVVQHLMTFLLSLKDIQSTHNSLDSPIYMQNSWR